VIVIVGILASVAMVRMFAIRNDAKVTAELKAVKQALLNLGSEYTSKNALVDYTIADAQVAVKCFIIESNSADGAMVSVNTIASDQCPQDYIDMLKKDAYKVGITNADGSEKLYRFSGISIVR